MPAADETSGCPRVVCRRKGWEAVQKLIKLQRENSMPTSSSQLFRMNLAALVIPGVIRCGFELQVAPPFTFSPFFFFC